MCFIQWQGWPLKQPGQREYGDVAPRRTLIDLRLAGCHGFGIFPATRIGAQGALGLGQAGVNLVDKPGIWNQF